MRLLLLIFVVSFYSQFALSQQEKLRFKHISTLTGLSQNWVRCIYQDDLGYMWFGTADGLNRYDGYDFKIFLPNPGDKYSIGSMYINSVSRKSIYELWICTINGAYIYNQNQERFFKFTKLPRVEVRMVTEDSKKNLWFATSIGLYKYNPVDSSMVKYTHDEKKIHSISNNDVQCIFEDSKKNI